MVELEVTTAEMEALIVFLPVFEEEQFEPIVEWNPWPLYSPQVKAFNNLAGKKCWNDFNYLGSEAVKKIDDDDFIAAASLDEIKSLLTLYMRSERFGDGNWASFLENGRVTAILRRIEVISDELQGAGATHF